MFAILKKLKHKHLLTLNKFVNKTKNITLENVKEYNGILSKKAQRFDFIPYDNNGKFIANHKPLFKNWVVCDETSDVKSKVAKLVKDGKIYRAYFQTKNGTVLVSEQNVSDNCTYNDVAIFFESSLELN